MILRGHKPLASSGSTIPWQHDPPGAQSSGSNTNVTAQRIPFRKGPVLPFRRLGEREDRLIEILACQLVASAEDQAACLVGIDLFGGLDQRLHRHQVPCNDRLVEEVVQEIRWRIENGPEEIGLKLSAS